MIWKMKTSIGSFFRFSFQTTPAPVILIIEDPLYYLKFILIYYRCGISNYKDTTHRNFILCLMFSSNFGIWSHFSLINKNVTRWRHNRTILLHPIYASLQHKFSDLCFKKHKISKSSSVFHERMETVLIWWRFRRITSYLLGMWNKYYLVLHYD